MEKAYIDKRDIMQRYNCGVTAAQEIIHAIKVVNGGQGALRKGKVLPSELTFWEENRGKKRNDNNLRYHGQ